MSQNPFYVVGGELTAVDSLTFRAPQDVDFVGVFATREEAQIAWRSKAQSTVDNALMRYFVLPLDTSKFSSN